MVTDGPVSGHIMYLGNYTRQNFITQIFELGTRKLEQWSKLEIQSPIISHFTFSAQRYCILHVTEYCAPIG